jgi:transposase
MSSRVVCSECIIKQEEIYKLRQEVKRLKNQLGYQERKAKEGYFGSSTPSSKIPVKKNSDKNSKEKKRGGAKSGHAGNGRQCVSEEQADRIENVNINSCCPECGNKHLEFLGRRKRTVIEYITKRETVVYQLERNRCRECETVFQAKAPGVLPKNLFGNSVLAHVATEHYLNGIRLGHLERQTNINMGSLIQSMHQLSRLFKDVPNKLISEYRKSAVKHADETGWRNDGQNGYAWIFISEDTCAFRFRKSRAGKIAQDVLGKEKLPGVLVVDRYNGYNKSPCDIQYCYAHLLRDVQDLQKEFPDNQEVNRFVQAFAPLLSEAMKLRSLPISNEEFYQRAAKTKEEIIKLVNSQANHFGIQKIQNIFREKHERLYHWADSRAVPADNNYAERELRPLVMSRKVSFCSHSDAGAKTREILMTILKTLKLRTGADVKTEFNNALDRIAENPEMDIYEALFGKKSRSTHP